VVSPPRDDSLWPGWREISRQGSDVINAAVIEVCGPAGCTPSTDS